ncbi:uncharacterized protein LOC142319171 [Lycorma delicatula]|uniref:uncharacterized protein LOC142319171 n=1 Tax=Lycorma delicatula TaxID=130591 RepID=UPI003F517A4C
MCYNLIIKAVQQDSLNSLKELLKKDKKIEFSNFQLYNLFQNVKCSRMMKYLLNYFDAENKDLSKVFKINTKILTNAVLNKMNISLIKEIVSKGGNINGFDENGITPLYQSLKNKSNIKYIREILTIGASVNEVCNKFDGNTVLHLVNDKKIITLLLEFGAKVNVQNFEGLTPIMLAIINKFDDDIVIEYINKGADLNLSDCCGKTVLMYALKFKRSKNLINKLIINGANVNAIDYSGRTPLIFLLKYVGDVKHLTDKKLNKNKIKTHVSKSKSINKKSFLSVTECNAESEIIMLLINNGADINMSDLDKVTPLMYAIINNSYYKGIVTKLIDIGADINASDNCGKTPLMYALMNINDTQLAYELINRGADVNAEDNSGKTSLMYSLENKVATKFVFKLIDKESGIHKCDEKEKTPLIYALVNECSKEIIIRLINEGSDVNNRDITGLTPLMYAVMSNAVDVVSHLIEKGADVNGVDNDGAAVLFYSLTNDGSLDIVSLLLDNGANVNVTYVKGKTVLMNAIEMNKDFDFVATLLNYIDDPNKFDNEGKTLLMYLVENSKYKQISLMLIYDGVNILNQDLHGNTVLHFVEDEEIMYTLIDYGAPINVANKKGITLLIKAVMLAKDVTTIKYILENGGNPNCFDTELNTPLHFATTEAVVNLLVLYGANINAKNTFFITPLKKATLRGPHAVVDSIIKHLVLISSEEINVYSEYLCFFSDFIRDCETELKLMKVNNIADNLTFFDISVCKKLKFYKFHNLFKSKYLYNYEKIKTMFPIFFNIIILKIKALEREKQKNYLMKMLSRLTVVSEDTITINNVSGDSENSLLSFDCLYSISRYLNYKQLSNLFLSSL